MIKKLKLGHVLALGLMFWLWVSLANPVQAIFWDQVKISGLGIQVNFPVVDWQFQVYVDDQLINEQFNQPDFSLNQSQLEINLHQKVRNICFDYQISSYDQPPFDNPVLNLSVNSKPVFQTESLDLSDQNYQTEWQKIGLDLSGFDQPEFKFSSFGSLDNYNPSSVNIKNLTSQCAVINPNSQIKLEVQPTADLFYQIKPLGENSQENDWQNYNQPLKLNGLTAGWYQIYYYAHNQNLSPQDQQNSPVEFLTVFFQPNQPSSVNGLNLIPTDQSVLLSWPDDYSEQHLSYQLDYQTTSCTSFDPQLATKTQVGYQKQAKPFYAEEITGLVANQLYCLTIKACNQSGWCGQSAEYTFTTL